MRSLPAHILLCITLLLGHWVSTLHMLGHVLDAADGQQGHVHASVHGPDQGHDHRQGSHPDGHSGNHTDGNPGNPSGNDTNADCSALHCLSSLTAVARAAPPAPALDTASAMMATTPFTTVPTKRHLSLPIRGPPTFS